MLVMGQDVRRVESRRTKKGVVVIYWGASDKGLLYPLARLTGGPGTLAAVLAKGEKDFPDQVAPATT